MFSGEESVRIRSDLPREKLADLIEETLDQLGVVESFGRGEFEVSASRFQSFATKVNVTGDLSKGRKEGEWILRINYSVQPTALCWVIAIVGFFLCFFGPLILLMPFLAKSEVQRAIERAVRDARLELQSGD